MIRLDELIDDEEVKAIRDKKPTLLRCAPTDGTSTGIEMLNF